MKMIVPFPPKSKARPRVVVKGGRSIAFMPKDYEQWKDQVRAFVKKSAGAAKLEGPLRCSLHLHQDSFEMTLECIDDDKVYLRGDVDNMAGGILDAIQPKKGEMGLIDDDRQIRELHVTIAAKVTE